MQKIMFNDRFGLTAAVFEGRKTQTRRIIKELKGKPPYSFTLSDFGIDDKGKAVISAEFKPNEFVDIYPKYHFGDVVAVAQPYGSEDVCKYQRQMLGVKENSEEEGHMIGLFMLSKGWSNKMFVAAGLMPHQIRIENIRVERLQDISDEDLEKEGVEIRRYENSGNEYVFYHPNPYRNGNWGYVHYHSLQDASQSFFDNICGKGTWERNPWVFVYEFELIN